MFKEKKRQLELTHDELEMGVSRFNLCGYSFRARRVCKRVFRKLGCILCCGVSIDNFIQLESDSAVESGIDHRHSGETTDGDESHLRGPPTAWAGAPQPPSPAVHEEPPDELNGEGIHPSLQLENRG